VEVSTPRRAMRGAMAESAVAGGRRWNRRLDELLPDNTGEVTVHPRETSSICARGRYWVQ
jgi:hypothetical protein